MVNMCVYSKQSLEDVLNYWKEILWIACVFITWEIFLVVNIFLSPHHYVCNIFVCWKHDWLLGFSICPEIFKLRSCCHLWAMTLCWDWCKQCAKLIIEIDNSNAKPIFKNFTWWKTNCFLNVTSSNCCFICLSELKCSVIWIECYWAKCWCWSLYPRN